MLEQVAQHDATGRLIGVDADELRPLVGGADRAFGQLAADVIRLLVVGASERLPDLLLARMVVGDRERHQLLQRHAVLGIDVEELVGHRRELQPLLDDGRVHEEPGRDLLLAQPLLAQGLEGAKLVERMQGDALDVLGQRILFGEAALPHHARHGLGLGHPLLLHQQFERPEAAATGRHLEHAGLLALRVQHGPDAQALQERAPGDVLGQLLDGDAGLDPAHIGLAEHQLVEGDVARGAEGDLLNGGCHVDILRDGRPKASLSTSNPSWNRPPSSPSRAETGVAAGPARHARRAAVPSLRVSGFAYRRSCAGGIAAYGAARVASSPGWSACRARPRRPTPEASDESASRHLQLVGRLYRVDGLARIGPEGEQVVGRLRSGAGGADDGAIVFAQHLEPGADIVGMAHRRHDAERGADEGAGHLGDQLLLGIQRRAESAGQIASEPRGMTDPVAIMPISA